MARTRFHVVPAMPHGKPLSESARFGLLALLQLTAPAQDQDRGREPEPLVVTSMTGSASAAGTALSALIAKGYGDRQRDALTWLCDDAARPEAKLAHPFRAYLLASAEPRPADLVKRYTATENDSPSHRMLRELLAADLDAVRGALNGAPPSATRKRFGAIDELWENDAADGRVGAFVAMHDPIPLGAIHAVIEREDPAVAMRMFAAHAESLTVVDELQTWSRVEKFAVMVRVANSGSAGGVKIAASRRQALVTAAAESAQKSDLSPASTLVHMHVLVSSRDDRTDVRGPLIRFAQSNGPAFVRRAAWHCLALHAPPEEFVKVAKEAIRVPATEAAMLRVLDRAGALIESLKTHGTGAAVVADQLRPLLRGNLENSWTRLCVRTVLRSLTGELAGLLEPELAALAENASSGVAEAARAALSKR